MGGTIRKYDNSSITLAYVGSSGTATTTSNTYVQVTPDQDITDGSEATVTVQGTVKSSEETGFIYFRIENVTSTVDEDPAQSVSYSTNGVLGVFKTPAVSLQ